MISPAALDDHEDGARNNHDSKKGGVIIKKVTGIQRIFTIFWGLILLACSSKSPDQSSFPRPPGVVIDHLPKSSGNYIGSPCILIMPNGNYMTSNDWTFRGEKPYPNVSRIFRSTDRGRTWEHISTIPRSLWATLFLHRGDLYLMGATGRYQQVVIRKSTDSGRTWTEPKDSDSGLLDSKYGYHTAAVPVVVHDGRIWRCMEHADVNLPTSSRWSALVMSAPVDSDLLKASNWTFSNAVQGNTEWMDGQFDGWLEGNAVLTPDRQIVNIIRVTYPSREQIWVPEFIEEKVAVLRLSEDGQNLTFDPERDMVTFPGGNKKFTIRFDPVSKLYWSATSYIPEKYRDGKRHPRKIRNTMALISSPDLRTWTVRTVILHHPDPVYHGLHYADWRIDGDDMLVVSRTAYDDEEGGAVSFHDANYLTFHRVPNFRQRTIDDPVLK